MLYSKIADRALLSFQNPQLIYDKALEYVYEAENRLLKHSGNLQAFYNDLMVRSDNSHIIDLPDEFVKLAGRIEWNGVPLTPMPDYRQVALNKNDLSWNTGQPFYYFIINRQLYLYPEPNDTTKRLGILLDVVPRESRSAFAEVSTVYVTGTLEGGEYFYLSSGSTDWCIYFTYDGVGVDPDITGKTSVVVTITSSMTDTQIATAITTAIDALTGVGATSSGATVTITQSATGVVKNIVNIDTPFLLHTTVSGQSAITSPYLALPYHDILPIFVRAQIYKDKGDRVQYKEEIAEWKRELVDTKDKIIREGRTNPSGTIDRLGGGSGGRLPTRPMSNAYSMIVTTNVVVRRGSQDFDNVTSFQVQHNWGTYPIPQLMDENDVVFSATITYDSANAFTVDFGSTYKTGTCIYT